MLEILGPIFLTAQQVTTPKETGPGFREIYFFELSGNIFHIIATTCQPEKMREELASTRSHGRLRGILHYPVMPAENN